MQKQFQVDLGKPYPLGVSREGSGINVAFASKSDDCGIIVYDRKEKRKLYQIPFSKEHKKGDIYYIQINDIQPEEICYQFYEDGEVVRDFYARAYEGHARFGEIPVQEQIYYTVLNQNYNWEADENPQIPYEDSIFYCMHVRGFTMHVSSKVQARGTYQGIIDKIPYLKELGVTTIELMPAYEFYERELPVKERKESIPHPLRQQQAKEARLNYWGYTRGNYYTPKNGYAAGVDAVTEFKHMVKELHKNHMEVVMQFYFTPEVSQYDMIDILRFWALEYHVDGFHVKGVKLPLSTIASDPGLIHTKFMADDFPTDEIYSDGIRPAIRNLASYNDGFRYCMRDFLKGDQDMLPKVLYHMKANPALLGKMNYFTNYEGFTFMDMVSYERKHNEENGENNRDGNDYNHSWNCGVEGKSRKKAIMSLRLKQIKNALCMLFLSQGTPLIYMGDEFGNSQNGNNNPYCQDNEISWLNWRNKETNKEIYDFIRRIIALRKQHPILHKQDEFRNMDYISCGYPDLSYHGTQAWCPDMGNYCRHIALMYCGKYARIDRVKEDNFFYLAMNMHWETHEFSLPTLPKGMQWYLLEDTKDGVQEEKKILKQSVMVPERTVQIYVGK